MEGVVRAPSEFSMTLAVCEGQEVGAQARHGERLRGRLEGPTLPSITATQLFVVPRSMPITSLPLALRKEVGGESEPEQPSRRRHARAPVHRLRLGRSADSGVHAAAPLT